MKPEIEFPLDEGLQARRARLAPLLALGMALVGVLAIYWETTAAVVSIWHRSETFAHGFLVIPISLWLVWRRRDSLATLTARPFWLGLVAVGVAGFGWMLGELAGVAGLAQFGVLFLLIAAAVTILGTSVSREITFPLVFLVFAVPTGEFLVPRMMDLTADFTVTALQHTGIPVYREGNQFLIPSGAWSVVEACSGIRYLIASVMAGTVYAYLTYRSPTRRAAFMAASFVVPITANWIRAYSIVMLGHLSGNRIAVGVDHLVYGWVFFGIVIFLMFWVGSFWREDEPAPSTARSAIPQRTAVASPHNAPALFGAALGVLVLAGIWHPFAAVLEARSRHSVAALAPIVSVGRGWETEAVQIAAWKPRFEGASAEIQQVFAKGADRVGVYIAYYSGQMQGRELISSGNVLVSTEDPDWRRIGSGIDSLPWSGSPVRVRSAVLSGRDIKLDVRYVYWVDGRWTSSDIAAKALLALAKLLGRGDDSAVVAIFAPIGNSADATSELLHTFAGEMSPAIASALARTREQ